jgi:multiple sugar transport system ATP-binding protein
VRQASGQLIAGVRPEDFEDAALVGEARDQGTTFRANIELIESLGSELFAHFTVQTDQQIESQELRELAEDSGAGEVPGAGTSGEIVARLDPESKVEEGKEAELWVNGSKLHLFDSQSGRALTSSDGGGASQQAPATARAEPPSPEATAPPPDSAS